MKLIVLISVIAFAAEFAQSGDVDCNKPALDVPLDECCKMPNLHDDKVLTGIVMEQINAYKDQTLMVACTAIEKYFVNQKLIKDDTIDVEAVNKYIESCTDKSVQNWKSILVKNTKVCADEVAKRKNEIVEELKKSDDKAMKLDNDKCNISYLAFALCSIAVDFPECPEGSWTDNEKCKKQKDTFKTCGLKTEFWKSMFIADMKSTSSSEAMKQN